MPLPAVYVELFTYSVGGIMDWTNCSHCGSYALPLVVVEGCSVVYDTHREGRFKKDGDLLRNKIPERYYATPEAHAYLCCSDCMRVICEIEVANISPDDIRIVLTT